MLRLILLLLLTSCSPFALEREAYVRAYHSGAYAAVENEVSDLIDKKNENEQVWLHLDRGVERFVSGNSEGAIEDFQLAVETIDYFNECGFLETLGKTLFYDGAGPYRGDDYEQLLARIYFAFTLMVCGDESNAMALFRQAEEWSQKKVIEYAAHPATRGFEVAQNCVGKYVFAALLEKRGDLSNAEILYRQSGIDLGRGGDSTVLVICHNGAAPFKYTSYSAASQASAFALELFLGIKGHDPALSTLTGIPVPELGYRPYSTPLPTRVCLDDENKNLQPVFSITRAAELELRQKRPVVIARGAARLAMRRGAVYVAQRQDPRIGQLVDLGMLILNSATGADTRSWNLLPERIDIARFDVEPGTHTLQIYIEPTGMFPAQIKLKKGDLCLIHVFNLYPGNSQILIPMHFQETL